MVRRRYRRPIQIQLIIIIQALLDLILNMEDMDRLRSLVVDLLSLEVPVTDSPSLEVVHHPFPVEMEYCSLTVMHLLSLALLLSLMADTLDLLHTLVDIIPLLDLLHTEAVDTIHHLDLHTVVVDIMHLLDLLQGSLNRAVTKEVPVILNSLVLIRHGEMVITLPIRVDGEANKNMA